jgi:predicted enzyme related to lactoylglutathione lyase
MQHRLFVVLCIAAVLSCVAPFFPGSLDGEPVMAAGTPGEFVWHDLITSDPEAARPFYGAMFGWTFEPGEGIDPDYTIIKYAGRPIGGIVPVPQAKEGVVAQWISYLVVADVNKATAAFKAAGGRVLRGPLNARKDLRVSVVIDAQGAPLGLASRGPRVEGPAFPTANDWLWMEYVAQDPEAALKMYGDVVGFGHKVSETRENFTYYLLTTDRPRAGLFRSLWERDTSAWLPYVRVEDPAAKAARAVQLGGSIALAPGPRVRNGSLAIVLDPAGAPIALQKFPFETGVTP